MGTFSISVAAQGDSASYDEMENVPITAAAYGAWKPAAR